MIFLKTKDQAFNAFKRYKAYAETHLGAKIQCTRIEEHVVAMLAESRLPPSFLGQAVSAYVHIWNRCSTTSLDSKTPYELWHRKKPDVSHLRVWGCTAYVHIQKDKRTGIGSHMEKCVFIGDPDGYKGWMFYNPTTKRTVISE
jgi:hypothetical protein